MEVRSGNEFCLNAYHRQVFAGVTGRHSVSILDGFLDVLAGNQLPTGRKDHYKFGATTNVGFYPDSSFMPLNDLPGNSQSKS